MKFDKETIFVLTVCMLLMLAWPSISQYMGWAEIEEETPAAEVQQNTPPAAVQTNNTPAVLIECKRSLKEAKSKNELDISDIISQKRERSRQNRENN